MPQHLDALARANEVRMGGIRLRELIATKRVTFAEALDDDRAQRLDVRRLLAAQYRWGDDRADRALYRAHVGYTVKVRDLTARQRRALIALAEGREIAPEDDVYVWRPDAA